MSKQVDNSVDLLNLMRGRNSAAGGNIASPGLRVVVVATSDPHPLKLVFEGTPLALDPDIFEIPVSLYPLKPGDRILAYSMLGTNLSQRWGLLSKLNGGPVYMATMQGPDSLIIDGIDKTYISQDLVIPQYIAVNNTAVGGNLQAEDIRQLQAGDRVGISAIWDSDRIKYVIVNKY